MVVAPGLRVEQLTLARASRTRFLAWAWVVLSLLLGGCVDMTEDIRLDANGQCRIEITTAIHEKLLALDREETEARIREAMEALKAHAVSHLGARAHIRTYAEGGRQHFSFIANLDSAEAAEALLNHHHKASEAAQDQAGARHVTRFSRPYRGTLHFEKQLTGVPRSDPSTPEMRALLAALLQDSTLTIRLHAPAITRANGDINPEGTTVQWTIPLARLALDPDFQQTLSADVPQRSTLAWWLAGGVALVLVIVLVLRRKPRDSAIYRPL